MIRHAPQWRLSTILLANLALALIWLALTGQFTPVNLLFGFIVAALLIWVAGSALGFPGVQSQIAAYFRKGVQVVGFLLFFAGELVLANLRMAWDVIRLRLRPAIVDVPLDVESDLAITLLSNLITLTPGTLTLDVSSDRRLLTVHTSHVGSPGMGDDEAVEHFRRTIKGLEARLQRVLA